MVRHCQEGTCVSKRYEFWYKSEIFNDYIHPDGATIEYEGHDVPKDYFKDHDQEAYTDSGSLTENGKFIQAVKEYKRTGVPERVKVYEKIIPNRWSFKGAFDLVDYKIVNDGKRNVFRFVLKLSDSTDNSDASSDVREVPHTRLIPSSVKQEVYLRDGGKCVLCGSTENLHLDHDLPFSKGGTSLSADNIRILCQKCNLKKSNKIEQSLELSLFGVLVVWACYYYLSKLTSLGFKTSFPDLYPFMAES